MINPQKQIILIGITFMAIISILFFNIREQYAEEQRITKEEIIGVNKIATINQLAFLLKSSRGLTQLKEDEARSLKQILFIKDERVMEIIRKIKDTDIENFYLDITNNKLTKREAFNKYTKLIKLLNNKRLNTADSSYLLFEGDRNTYFLMTTTILDIPQMLENIGVIRGLGIGLINNHKNKKETEFLLETNLKSFLDKVEDIKFTINKIDSNKKNEFESLLNFIVSDFYNIRLIATDIQKHESTITSKEYFLEISKLVNKINNLFYTSKNFLTQKLEKRESELSVKLFIGSFIYLILLSISILGTFLLYNKNRKEVILEKKKRKDNNFIQFLQKDYIQGGSNLKVICNKSLNHIINYFKAINGSLYLYNQQNEKLYLGATYGIKHNMLDQTIDMHENLIAENILEKNIKIVDINEKINLGNMETLCTKIITIPIIEFEKSIGTMQLVFDDKFKTVDIDFLQSVISIMATYINKAQKDDESSAYLKVIDKHVLISQTDLDGNIIEVSEQLCTLSQYTKEEMIGKNHRILKHPDMKEEIYTDIWNTITKGENWYGELKNKKKDGGYYWIDSSIFPDYDINGNIIGYTAIRVDITDRKKIEQIAITDGLTNLYNRRHFDTIFPQQIEINKREKGLLAFLLIDIDHFKQYNDTYGHQEGDQVLKNVAKALKDTLRRPSDYTFRLGGEEFGLLYQVMHEEDALSIANQARQNIEDLNIEHLNNSASKYVTISSGLYIIHHTDNKSVSDIYKITDNALYISKEKGRNQVNSVD